MYCTLLYYAMYSTVYYNTTEKYKTFTRLERISAVIKGIIKVPI